MYEGDMDIERKIHDQVFIESIDRRERIARFLQLKLGIDEKSARDESLASQILLQLLREGNPMLLDIEYDAEIFISEWCNEDVCSEEAAHSAVSRGPGKNSFYDRAKAKAYIDTYWKNYNPAYPSFKQGGGDCANFVSQILYAGGMPWVDDGIPANYKNSKNWYCKPGATAKDSDRKITFSWKIAASFKLHWIKRVDKHFMVDYSDVINSINDISDRVYVGDVVQFCYSSGVPYHTLAVTGFNRDPEYNVNDIVLASHDIDSNSRSLFRTVLKSPGDYKLRVYVVKDGE